MELFHSKKVNKKEGSDLSSQKYINVEEIKNDIVVLKNKSLRAILLVSSINFDLKSSEEQEAITYGYQGFLNSLDFPIQILISSKRLDIEPYINLLEQNKKLHTNELMRMQISEYSNFVRELTEVSQIMSKNFYVVVPFYPVETKGSGFFSGIMDTLNPKQKITENLETFETYKNQLWQRVDQVAGGLNSIGVKSTVLKTEEIIELLYSSYNPSLFSTTVIKDLEAIELE
ncbi:MAG: hypothetical protein PHH24_04405 [Candidatus Moranbacteria bacterium]|jgi:hypothetical protein|nr:hypothetical protein [Candidatus Moranbacteria bacterium]MDD5652251.1 hypothetical protein [Candidatus Moranbacteria bacterium]MDX9856046.1 hypothetical protein [Candidatus Moranbacteria bacterium]